MSKKSFATVWLDGCSGCHMSFLDIDERLLELADSIDLVYSPLVDHKQFPEYVDMTLVEGSVSSSDDLAKIKKVRAHTGTLIALGDCAVTGNVPALRNSLGAEAVLRRANLDDGLLNPTLPGSDIPRLLTKVLPVQAAVPVDVFIPGCPPSAETILYVITELLAGRTPDISPRTRFGK